MNTTIETPNFLKNLERVSQVRAQIVTALSQMLQALAQSEIEGEHASGQLSLERDIEDLRSIVKNLRQGVFRLLVLGDMKRGKSTLLNVLIGENLLPSDVNPCTALLTILRYGPEKQVTIHFNDGPPEVVDFPTFKQRYTIDPGEAKQLEQAQQLAFPTVAYAEVEYPLPLLEKGVELVDSPGLNDTEARNELSLGYIQNCHAILFVLRASQPCTLAERRYLENFIQDRGLTVFFLINAWDQVRESLVDPDDPEELKGAEDRLRKVFKTHLAEYCQVDGYDFYSERVFELSALPALRRRIKTPEASLAGTGFPEFMGVLNTFLTQERAIAEFRQVRTLARQTAAHVNEALERRIPLLEQDVDELKRRLNSVEPEFTKLGEIRNDLRDEIYRVRDRQARAVAESFRNYVLNLENTFETDFLKYQPELKFLDFLSQGKRKEFEAGLKQSFQNYVNDKFFAWTRIAQKELEQAFSEVSKIATQYGASYQQVTDRITAKLTEQPIRARTGAEVVDESPTWLRVALGITSLLGGNLAGAAMAGAGFNWENIMLNFITAISISSLAAAVFGIAFGPITFTLVGLGLGALQADQARKQLVKTLRKELAKSLPQVAQEQQPAIENAVLECFDAYEKELIQRIDEDIKSRKVELDNLLKQKETREINRNAEVERLKRLQTTVTLECEKLEHIYQTFLSA